MIDDNPIIQRTIYFALRDKGYKVLTASDIASGMKTLRREKLDLILLDLSFPLTPEDIGCLQQDGFFFIGWINRTPDVAKPPIIIISSTEPSKYSERVAAAGIKVCLHKPLDKETLLAAVRSSLDGDKSREATPQP